MHYIDIFSMFSFTPFIRRPSLRFITPGSYYRLAVVKSRIERNGLYAPVGQREDDGNPASSRISGTKENGEIVS